ncbi:MAG: NADP-dependent oxidoreductase [Cytophagaceae bacterium]|nr:NADP-dependent oxidoreductase [Cytophagaceae bacterium]
MNKIIVLDKRPLGRPDITDFRFIQEEMPQITEGEILLETLFVSVDPYLRGRMNDAKSYVPPFELNKPVQSTIIAKVIGSHHGEFRDGDFVSGNLDWKEYQTSSGKGLIKLNAPLGDLSKYLGVLGMTGMTAYLGLTEVGKPNAGETIVISGAAGAVGSVVGQIGKILGCRVVGITSTDKKADLLKSKFHFDEVINYIKTPDLKVAIKEACRAGVDIYFDNVGGEISDAVLFNINKYARIPLCGAISLYNEVNPVGPRLQPILIIKRAMMRGFLVSDFTDQFPAAIQQLAFWLKEGKISYAETIVQGFDNIPQAFIDLFDGKNEGKMIVKVK